MTYAPTPHPVFPVPNPTTIEALARAKKIKPEEAFVQLNDMREDAIKAEAQDPLRHGWEPQIWTVCDCLLGLPWVDRELAEKVRRRLGFERPVRNLLINGGNRAGKSEYAAKRIMRLLSGYGNMRTWCFHSKEDMSIDYQHPLLWKFFPQEWRKKQKSEIEYSNYSKQNGFANGKFTLPNASDNRFYYYSMDIETVEGANLNAVWNDELVTPPWIKTQLLRVAEKNGFVLTTFTPIQGYTSTVALFQDGAKVVFQSPGFLLPKDGGKPDLVRALRITDKEFEEVDRAVIEQRAPRCLPLRSDNILDKILDETYDPKSEFPAGREFELVPRVMRPSPANDPKGLMAVVFFYTSDNPYSNAINVANSLLGKPAEEIKERFHGIGHRLVSTKFPKFSRDVHVIPAKQAMEMAKKGTKYNIVDPAGGRNFFKIWGAILKDDVMVIYREWPGNFYIPEVGYPGPWATSGDEKHHDGRVGAGQKSFGFGYWKYKRELARLEGWYEYEKGLPEQKDGEESLSERDWIIGLEESSGAREKIIERIMDSRPASTPRPEKDRPTTLLTDFDDIGITFHSAPGLDVDVAVQKINDMLDYDTKKPPDFFNQPKLFISEDCLNCIFALATWTGMDGSKGATKDPIDTIGYWLLSDPVYVEEGDWESQGGGSY